jgi:cytochrome c oxidase assembly protein subunit 15
VSAADVSSLLLRRLAVASLVANILIVGTGGAVRLTASGLGCPTWPSCTENSLVNTPEHGIHGFVEFGNRLLTFALAAVVVATLVAAFRDRPRRKDVLVLSAALVAGIPLQAVIGGITVLTQLNPWVVMLHFLASMLLIAVAMLLVRRTREPEGPLVPVVPGAVRSLAVLTMVALVAVVYVGAVVTGSGPHAGDRDARRTGLDPELMSQLHADLVFLLLGLSIGLWLALRAVGAPAAAVRAAALFVALELAQGVIGFVQYFTDLPIVLVGLHMLGASVLVAAGVHVMLALREPAPVDGAAARPAGDAGPRPPRTRAVSAS